MASDFLKIRFGMVFQEDGLDKDGIREELLKVCNVMDESDGSKEDINHNVVPIWVYILEGDFSDYIKIKLKYNCEVNEWLLFPIEPLATRSIFAKSSE